MADRPHDEQLRLVAKAKLRCPPVHFTGVQARAVGRAFVETVRSMQLTIWACSILPDHVHLVLARHRLSVEQIANPLKGDASRQLTR